MRRSLYLLLALGTTLQAQEGVVDRAAGPAVAYASFAPLNTDIFVARPDGSDPRPLLAHPALDYNASFSPDGRWVVFTSERNGSADIYRVLRDGSGLERLTNDAAFDDQGVLSPDGKTLAFVSSRGGQADVWILDLASGALRNLTSHPAGDFRPAWSPDGQWIAFSSDRDSPKRRSTFVTLHATEIYVIRRDGSGLRRLTTRGAFVGSPTWSADGMRLLAYEAELDDVAKIGAPRRLRGTTQIVAITVATGGRVVVTSGAGEKWSPRWLSDGRIAYVSGGPAGGLEFVRDVGTAGPELASSSTGARGALRGVSWAPGGDLMVYHRDVETDWPPHRPQHSRDPGFRLVRTGVFASYAPAGERLVVNDGTAGIVHNRVLIMQADGSARSVLFADSARSALAPAWSPRDDRIAFALGRFFPAVLGPSAAAIVTIRSDGTDLQFLSDTLGNAGFPSWSPDGTRLVYRTVSGGRSALFIVDARTRTTRRLTDGTNSDNSPSWSPKGDLIVFTSKRDDADYDIYVIRPDGTGLRRLTRTPGNDSHPSWSPDGEWIAFTSARGGFKDEAPLHPFNPQPYGDIYVMRADGSDVRMLTDNQFEDGTPTWVRARRNGGKP